jgi:hypothetical protein
MGNVEKLSSLYFCYVDYHNLYSDSYPSSNRSRSRENIADQGYPYSGSRENITTPTNRSRSRENIADPHRSREDVSGYYLYFPYSPVDFLC